MLKNLTLLFCLGLLSACAQLNMQASEQEACDSIYYFSSPNDSLNSNATLCVCSNDYTRTLALYHNVDSMHDCVDQTLCISIFEINNERYAVFCDTTLKVFKFKDVSIDLQYQIPIGLGMAAMTLEKIDLNNDGYKDLVIRVPQGGTYGDDCVIMFYDSHEQTLVFDSKVALRNISIDTLSQTISSHFRYSTVVYKIVQNRLVKYKEMVYLHYTSSDPTLNDKVEVKIFDNFGALIRIDTLKLD